MNTASPPCPTCTDRKALYQAAILETDRTLIQRRIAEAEAAVLACRRELFYDSGTLEEKEAVEDALYALGALRTACQHSDAPEAA